MSNTAYTMAAEVWMLPMVSTFTSSLSTAVHLRAVASVGLAFAWGESEGDGDRMRYSRAAQMVGSQTESVAQSANSLSVVAYCCLQKKMELGS